MEKNLHITKPRYSQQIVGAIHSTKLSGNFGPKLNGSVRSNRKSFEKTGPPFEVVPFSRSDRLEFWLNGSRPVPVPWHFVISRFHCTMLMTCRYPDLGGTTLRAVSYFSLQSYYTQNLSTRAAKPRETRFAIALDEIKN